MGTFILVMVLSTASNAISSFTVEYSTKEKYEVAKEINSRSLGRHSSIILASCTAK